MINAIIYTSNSGYTKKYADILSKKLSLPCYELREAEKSVAEGEHIIYLGWVMANHITGLDKAFKKYVPCCVCAVGLSEPSEKNLTSLSNLNKTGTAPLFYLQGGFDMKKQKGIKKFIMKMISSSLSKKADKTNSEKAMLKAISDGANFISEKNLEEVIKFAQNSNI